MLRRIARDNIPIRHRVSERGFNLALPLVVEGPDLDGRLFREETTLAYMSHAAAVFPLASPVALGTRLKIALALPPKLAEGRDLRLVVKGTVVFIDPSSPGAHPVSSQISLRLENRYIVETGPALAVQETAH